MDKINLKPVDILKKVQPSKFNFGSVTEGDKVPFEFYLTDLPEALGFTKGCNCQGDMILSEKGENGIQKLSGTIDTSMRMDNQIVANFEKSIDVYFNNPSHLEINEATKEAKVGGGAVSVRLWISGNVRRREDKVEKDTQS